MVVVKRKKRVFRGSWCIFVILLCFGIIPALIYYWIKCEEIETTEENEY